MAKRSADAGIKDHPTSRLRERLLSLPSAVETGDAMAGLTTLSFTSRSHSARHVWVDTDLAGATKLDLEDRSIEGVWDNSVRRLEQLDDDAIVSIVHLWLSGEPVAAIDNREV